MADNYDPKYDTDNITLGYLKKVIGEDNIKNSNNINQNTTMIKNFGSTPIPPYSKGDTWTTISKIYKCINSRKLGNFNFLDWIEIYDKETNTAISKNFQFLSSIEFIDVNTEKIETFYQTDFPDENWSTDEIKNTHIGDYYQDSSNYKTYIYTYKNKVYSWEEKDVTSIIFEPRTSHRNIFLKKPSSYNENDLWRINNEEDIKLFPNGIIGDYFKANKTNSLFNLNDWSKVDNELSIKANLYSSIGFLISEGNLLTNLQYDSNGIHNGYSLLGFYKYFTTTNGTFKSFADIVVDVDLPDNFNVISAYLTIFHTPVYWSYWNETGNVYSDNWGCSRNVRLYKIKNENNFKLYMSWGNEYRYEVSSSDLEEIPNAFKATSFNPTNTTGKSIQSKTTINLKSSLNKKGKTKLVVRSGDSVPSDDYTATAKTGMARAIINIVGYINPKEE